MTTGKEHATATSIRRVPDRERKLRIGVVAPPMLPVPPSGYGGIERVVALLVDGLVEKGHDVTLFAEASSVTRARLVSPIRSSLMLGDPAQLADELYHNSAAYRDANEFDVIHDHTGTGAAFGAMVESDTLVVHTLHGPWTPYSRRLFELIGDRVQVVAISHAQQTANALVRYAGVVYNGIDLRSHPFQSDKEDFLVFLGRVCAEKRPEIAIEVARAAKLPLVMLIKATEPNERAYFNEFIAPRLSSDVTVLEEPSHSVKVNILGRARALLFPIDWPEPFGLVMIEAMACGTPVITTPLGAAPEIVSEGVTGFLCTTKDEMIEAVNASVGLKAKDCRDRVERHFSARAMVAHYERLYRDLHAGVAYSDGLSGIKRHLETTRVDQNAHRLGA
ncbi:MAG TPA: glycosyltransferase family 4 protein [Acidimicrobiales bacterium]|nr:glycosyltransferase family 4 protein [Acidimicrobiales bacterium]